MLKTPVREIACRCGCGQMHIVDADNEFVAVAREDVYTGTEIVRRCNAHSKLLEACKTWLEAVQNSLSLRLALTGLPEGAGPVLVEMLQEAIALAEGEGSDTAQSA